VKVPVTLLSAIFDRKRLKMPNFTLFACKFPRCERVEVRKKANPGVFSSPVVYDQKYKKFFCMVFYTFLLVSYCILLEISSVYYGEIIKKHKF
jgi:hypothetical protein